jgi:hypothetical protein
MANAIGSTQGTPARRRGFTFWLVALALVAAVLVTLYTLFMLSWSYSEGERAGVLQKFSKRGWICKTYEGELAMYVITPSTRACRRTASPRRATSSRISASSPRPVSSHRPRA